MVTAVFPSELWHSLEVALLLYRNTAAAKADDIDGWYSTSSKGKGRKDLLARNNIVKVTPYMVAYAALQVYRFISCTPTLNDLLHRRIMHCRP